MVVLVRVQTGLVAHLLEYLAAIAQPLAGGQFVVHRRINAEQMECGRTLIAADQVASVQAGRTELLVALARSFRVAPAVGLIAVGEDLLFAFLACF